MTTEERTVKIWTYEFKDFELYLDTRIEMKTNVRSVAVCEQQSIIAIVTSSGATRIYTFKGDLIETINNENYAAVCCSGNHLIFGSLTGDICTFDLRFMQ